MSIEPAPKLNNNSSEGEKGAKNAEEGVDDISAPPTRHILLDEGRDDPGRLASLKVYGPNGDLNRDHVIWMDAGKREEIINNNAED